MAAKGKWNFVTHTSIGFASVILALVGTGGYLGYGDQVMSNVLDSFPVSSIPTTISRSAAVIRKILFFKKRKYLVYDDPVSFYSFGSDLSD